MIRNQIIRYWGRKPSELAQKYISRYSKPGDVVADFFGGSGIFIEAALKLGRKAVYIDLNPFAELVAHSLIDGCDISEYKQAIQKILGKKSIKIKLRNRIVILNPKKLFYIKCTCKRSVEAKSIVFTRVYQAASTNFRELSGLKKDILRTIQEKGRITHEELRKEYENVKTQTLSNVVKRMVREGFIYEREKPVRAYLLKPCKCGRTLINFQNEDIWAIKGPIEPCYWYPKDNLEYGNGKPFLKKRDVSQVNEFFLDRSLALLSAIWHDICRLDLDVHTKRCLKLTFMATLARSSKMCRESGGTWPINSYWIPRIFVVKNPYRVFENAARKIMQFLSKSPRFSCGSFSDVIKGRVDVAFYIADSTKVRLPKNSLDYVIIDPPHMDEAQFFELSLFYTSWLREPLDFENELVINSKQGKGLDNYLSMLKKAAEKIKYALKNRKYFTVILHEEDHNTLDKCFQVFCEMDFKPVKKEHEKDFVIYTFKN